MASPLNRVAPDADGPRMPRRFRQVGAVVLVAIALSVLGGASAYGGSTTPLVARTDHTPPQVLAMSSVTPLAPQIRLQYRIWDDSGRASITAEVRRGTTVLDRESLGERRMGFFYWDWRPPRIGTYKFCISATDAAGNKSRVDCTL